MPNSNIQWLDPRERPVNKTLLGRTICLKNSKGTTTILKIVPFTEEDTWFSSISWLNESDYKYIILPE